MTHCHSSLPYKSIISSVYMVILIFSCIAARLPGRVIIFLFRSVAVLSWQSSTNLLIEKKNPLQKSIFDLNFLHGLLLRQLQYLLLILPDILIKKKFIIEKNMKNVSVAISMNHFVLIIKTQVLPHMIPLLDLDTFSTSN